MKIIQSILTKNPCFTAGRKIAVKGLMLHSIGCAQPSALVFVNMWNSPSYSSACVHAFIDGNTGDIYQTLPWNHRGWHGGGSSNNTHIGVEMCEPGCIKYTGGATFTCSDLAAARASVERTYKAAVELFAHLCKEYNLDPLADGVIVSHKEGYARGIATSHGDPEHLWSQLGMGYTMNGFRAAVKSAMAQSNGTSSNVAVDQGKAVDYHGKVIASSLYCRAEPNGAIISSYPNGTVVHIFREKSGWGYTGDGWVSLDWIEKINEPEKEEDMDISKLTDEQCYKILQKAQAHAATLPCPEWAPKELQEAIDAGITDGTRPAALVTRCEAAIMAKRTQSK